MAVKKAGARGAKAPKKAAAAGKTSAKRPAKAVKAAAARPAKTAAKRPAARKPAARAAARQAAAASKEARYGCEVCGLMVTVDEWGDMDMVNIVCCGEQMQPV